MNNKVDKLYLVMTSPIVRSDRTLINSIRGYNVVERTEVATINDAIELMHSVNACLTSFPTGDVWVFHVIDDDTTWYLSSNFIACQHYDTKIKIEAFIVHDTVLVSSIDILITFKRLLGKIYKIRISAYNMYLSIPDKSVIINDTYVLYDINIKLPLLY